MFDKDQGCVEEVAAQGLAVLLDSCHEMWGQGHQELADGLALPVEGWALLPVVCQHHCQQNSKSAAE